MTAQEIFTKVKTHLLKQDKRSVQGGYCQYKNRYGHKCAVGCLIPSKYYRKSLENTVINDLIKKYSATNKFFRSLKPHVHLLRALQIIHDTIDPFIWKDALKDCADKFNLKY